MKTKQLRSSLMLALTALIWGVAFVAQSVGMDYVGPFTFNAARFIIGGLVLIPCIYFFGKGRGAEEGQDKRGDRCGQGCRDGQESWNGGRDEQADRSAQEYRDAEKARFKMGVMGGICCGFFLCFAAMLQQIGVSYTSVGKAGFITSLYIIIVPVLGLFMKKKVAANIWVSVAIATVGMYLLCMTEGLSIGRGDFYVFLGSIGFSFHILVIDYFSPKADGVLISCVQFFTAGIISAVFMFLLENPQWSLILAAAAPILYAGVMSCGIAYTMQVVAQKNIEPTVASLIMSLESVFSLLAGWVLLNQVLLPKEQLGCVLVFAAIVLAQIPGKNMKKAVVESTD